MRRGMESRGFVMCVRRWCIPFAIVFVVFLIGVATPASAQVDLTGSWTPVFHEDQPERVPGPEIGDYIGLPLRPEGRAFAEAWDASRLTVPEHQCRAHAAPYNYRGPFNMRIYEERDPFTQQLVAIRIDHGNWEQQRKIWMDGRPHPSPHAGHTWGGFSTGKWVGSALLATTTHIKQGWHRRNGVPQSDQALLTEYFVRHGDVITIMSFVEDPVFLTEAYVKTTNFRVVPRPLPAEQLLYPCQPAIEIAGQPRGAVPHYLPGRNPFLGEFAKMFGLPEFAARGGAETMYPEFRRRLETQPPR